MKWNETLGHLIKWIKFGVNFGVKNGVIFYKVTHDCRRLQVWAVVAESRDVDNNNNNNNIHDNVYGAVIVT